MTVTDEGGFSGDNAMVYACLCHLFMIVTHFDFWWKTGALVLDSGGNLWESQFRCGTLRLQVPSFAMVIYMDLALEMASLGCIRG